MDFHAMKRRQLQLLCKEHGIPANLKSNEMAERLTLLLKEGEKPIEAVCENLKENERECDSEVETKIVKKVKFSPENQTFYFVGTDNDSDSDHDYNPKKKQGGKRRSMVAKQVSEKKQARVVENSRELELVVEIFDSPGRVTRSRAQKIDKGDAETVSSPLPRKRKGKTGVKKVDVCEKPCLEVDLSEKVDGNAEHAILTGGLTQRQLRNRVVVSGDGGNSRELEAAVEILDSPGRVTRSRVQKMDKGDAETVSSPLPWKRKGRTGVKKVDVCEKPRLEVELSEKIDGNAEHAKLIGGLTQGQLRNRVVVSGDGGNSLALRKNVTRGSKKTKENKVIEGVPPGKGVRPQKLQKEYKGNVTKAEDSSDWSEKLRKIDLGGRITRSWALVEGKSFGVESKPGILKGKEEDEVVLRLEETFKGPGRKHLRRKSAAPLKGSLEGEKLAGEAVEPGKPIRRSKRNLARDSVCGQSTETKVVGRRKKPKSEILGKASIQEDCKEVPQLEEPSVGASMNTSRRKFPVVQKGKEQEKGDTRKRPRNKDMERASKVEQSVRTIEESVVLLPNGPLRRSRRKTALFSSSASDDRELRIHETGATVKQSTESVTEKIVKTIEESVILLPSGPLRRSRRKNTLFSSPAPDDKEFRIHEAAGTVKQSRESVSEKGSNVTKSPRLSSRNVGKKIVTEATDGMGEIFNGVKKDGIVKEIEEPTLEKESLYNVNDSLNKRPQRRSPRNASKSDLVAPTGLTGIAARKNKKSESRIPVIPEEDFSAKVNSPLEENPNLDVGLDVPEAAENENDIDSCSSKEVVEKSRKKRKGSSKKSESLNRGEAVGDVDDHSCPLLKRSDTGHDNAVERNPVECPDNPRNVVSSTSTCLGDGQSSTYRPDCEGERSNLLDLKEELETDELNDQLADGSKACVHDNQNLVQLDASGIDQPVLVEPVIMDHLTELVENKESGRNTEKSPEVIEEIDALSSDRKEIVQVDKSCPSLNRGGTGHDNAVAKNPGECPDKLSNVVSSRFTCLGDGHSPTYQPDCVGESSKLLHSKEGLETDDLAVKTPNQISDVVDDQLEHDSKASVSEDQNSVQLDASGTNQPVLVEPVHEDCLTELVKNKESDRSSEKSSEVVEAISAYCSCDREEMVQVDVMDDQLEHDSKASVPEDQNLNASGTNQPVLLTELVENKESDRSSDKSSEVVEEISALCPCDREEMVQVDVVDDQLEHDSKASVPEDQNSVQLDATGTNQPVLLQPVPEDCLTELVEIKESDRSSEKSSEVVEISALCHFDREEMVQVDVGSIETSETSAETVGDIHHGRIVPCDTAVTPSRSSLVKQDNRALELHDKSRIFTHWEISTIFRDEEQDVAEKSGEPPKGYSENKHCENAMDVADNTKIFERCDQQFSEQQLSGHEHDAEYAEGPILGDNNEQDDASALIQEYIDCEKDRDEHFRVENSNVCTHKPMFTEACRISEYDYTGLEDIAAENITISAVEDKCRNSGVEEDRARAMTGDRMEMQQPENRDTLLPFGSVDTKMGFPEHMVEFCVPAQGASIKVANERSNEVAETPLQFDELNFEGLGKCKELSSELGNCASAASGGSISRDDETAERLANVRKIEESSSKDVSFDAQRECNLDAIPTVISNYTSDQLAEKESPARNDNSLDDTVLVYGHRNNNVTLDEVGTRSMETITGIGNADDGTKFVEETQIRLDGGNLSEERNSSDANSFSGISSSSAYLGPSDLSFSVHNVSLSGGDPVRLPIEECDKFGTAEKVSGMKVVGGKDCLDNELGGDPVERDLAAQGGNEFGVPERVSGMKVGEGQNAGIISLGEENCTKTSQETEEDLDGMEIFSGHSKESPGFEKLNPVSVVKLHMEVDCSADTPVAASSHGTKALNLNAASPEMSKVNSMSENSADVKESAVVIPQIAAGQLTGHEYKLEEVVELKSTQEMGIHYHVGSPVTNFSTCGNDRRDKFRRLDAGLIEVNMRNEVSEDVKEGKENALGVAQVFAGQHGDHGQRMLEECLKSSHAPVSDENTCIIEGPKEIGVGPFNHEFVDRVDNDESRDVQYSNVYACTGKLIDDAEMSGSSSGAFDGAEAKSDPNYLNQARNNVNPDEDTKVPVESDTVSELNVTVNQCPTSANSVWRKEIFESTRKECREVDLDQDVLLWQDESTKRDSYHARTPTRLVNTFDMKENL